MQAPGLGSENGKMRLGDICLSAEGTEPDVLFRNGRSLLAVVALRRAPLLGYAALRLVPRHYRFTRRHDVPE